MEVNKIYVGDWVKVAETLPSGIAHLIITSPPYWGQRNYGVDGQLGLEKTPEEHIEKLVLGFRELRRVLRDDGVLFLNYGDKYGGGNNKSKGKDKKMIQKFSARGSGNFHSADLRSGDLIGLAWRLALALQADGWYLRSDIIWAKALSFCAKYSGSTMPESVNGWRWERHKVKVEKSDRAKDGGIDGSAQWKPCPGCAKCAPDSLILRKGSWRPTRAHEYLFQLTKTSSYYCDMEAVREAHAEPWRSTGKIESHGPKGVQAIKEGVNDGFGLAGNVPREYNPSGRNLRDVFCINPQAYPDSHYATFPEKLVEPCIKVGTSEKGCCPKCGAQWARIVDKPESISRTDTYKGKHEKVDSQFSHHRIQMFTKAGREAGLPHDNPTLPTTTLGWLPTCKCGIKETVPAVVLDPFCGTATVCAVAAKLGRNYIGIELNPDYVKNQAEYRVAEGETGISKEEQKAGQLALFK